MVVASWDGSSVLTGGEIYLKTEPEIEKELFDEILTSRLAMVGASSKEEPAWILAARFAQASAWPLTHSKAPSK